MSRTKKVSNVSELMDKWYNNIPGWDNMVAEEELKIEIGQQLYDLRERVGLSQTDLAKLIGTNQSIISKVENADYDGNSLSILTRVCAAMHTRMSVRIEIPPECRKKETIAVY